MWGDLLAISEDYAGMAYSEGCERNPFAREVLRPMVAYPYNLSEFEKNRLTIIMGSVLSDMHS